MPKRKFFFELTDNFENSSNIHREIIAEIEKQLDGNLICYYANPGHPGGALQDHDPDLLENILLSLDLNKYNRKIYLFINSPGGFPYAAGKMVQVCRTYSSEFKTIVISRAFSAATLLCLGSHELVMGKTASLGPIDPQMSMSSQQGQRLIPANVIIDSFKEMLSAAQQAILEKRPADPFFHVLDSLDITAVFESVKAISSTDLIAKDLLQEGLLRNDKTKIDDIVKALITEGVKELHGKHLYPDILQNLGLPVTILQPDDVLYKNLRGLLVRIENYAGRKGIAKYIVTREGAIDVNIIVRQM